MCLFFCLFIVIPVADLFLLVGIGRYVELSYILGTIIATGIIGGMLVKAGGMHTIYKMRSQISQGKVPGKELLDGILILIGAALLITPGIITDVMGLVMVFPGTRYFFRQIFIRMLKKHINFSTNFVDLSKMVDEDILSSQNNISSNVIDGEVISSDTKKQED